MRCTLTSPTPGVIEYFGVVQLPNDLEQLLASFISNPTPLSRTKNDVPNQRVQLTFSGVGLESTKRGSPRICVAGNLHFRTPLVSAVNQASSGGRPRGPCSEQG